MFADAPTGGAGPHPPAGTFSRREKDEGGASILHESKDALIFGRLPI